MMAWVHAAVGAALGSRMDSRRAAFAGGAASHLILDMFPHRDYSLEVELPLAAAAIGIIAARYGPSSAEMLGALGGIAPDIENGLERLGVVSETAFPTHTRRSWSIGHGRRIETPVPQIVLASLCFALLEYARRARRP